MTSRRVSPRRHAVLAGLDSSPLPCSPVARSPHPQRLPTARGCRGLEAEMEPVPPPPPSGLLWGWDQSGVCGGRPGHRRETGRGRGRAGERGQAGTPLARACSGLPVSGPPHEGRGQGGTAAALDPVCRPGHSCSGPLLSLCLGASPTEDLAGPPPGPMRSPGLQRVCQEGEQRALFTGVGDPSQKPGLNPRTWGAVGHICRAGDGQSKEAHPLLQSVPPGTHTSAWYSEVATGWGGQAVWT